MFKFLLTDFLINRTIQQMFMVCVGFELLFFYTLAHTLILFGMPYLTSVLLKLFIQLRGSNKTRILISRQYRTKTFKIRIIPR